MVPMPGIWADRAEPAVSLANAMWETKHCISKQVPMRVFPASLTSASRDCFQPCSAPLAGTLQDGLCKLSTY